ncbi:MAG: fibronectin type III-like domain-contianing protein [Flavobacteriaceae bacterium]|nr:MAG: fibronectin type III-like domain-contianing protein [Flavobacteriaceae bacterium]
MKRKGSWGLLAVKELKAFKKVRLKPGDQTRLNLEIPVQDLAYYDESISDWVIEPGDYSIYIGNASDKIYKKIKIRVAN